MSFPLFLAVSVLTWLLGIGAATFLLVPTLIVLVFGIPFTLRLKARGHLTSMTPLWRYCLSVVCLFGLYLAVCWAVRRFLPEHVLAYLVGAAMVLVPALGKLGANEANMADYLQSNARYIRSDASPKDNPTT